MRQENALTRAQANILAELSGTKLLRRETDSALRLALRGTRVDLALPSDAVRTSSAAAALAAAIWQANWRFALGGHDDFVNSAAFSPDGSRIVTASSDKTARIWDAATGKEIAVLRGHDDPCFRRLQPRRVAHRHGVSGQDRPHLGRRDRQGDRGPARP